MMYRLRSCLPLIAALYGLTASATAQVPQYRVADSIAVGNAEGDFYTLDDVHRRLYGAGPYVIDVDTKAIALTLPLRDVGGDGGFIVSPELGRGVVRNGAIFELATGRIVSHGVANGDGSVYEPVTRRAFLLDDTVAVIDVHSGALVGRMPVPGAGESGVADGRGRVYLNLMPRDSIAVFDGRTLKRVGGFSVAPCSKPMGLAMDRATRRLFVACDGQLAVVDADNGRIIATIETGSHTDQNAFDSGTRLIFMPSGKDKPLVIVHEDDPDHFTVTQRLSGPAITSVRAVVDEKTHRVYLPHHAADKRFYYVIIDRVE